MIAIAACTVVLQSASRGEDSPRAEPPPFVPAAPGQFVPLSAPSFDSARETPVASDAPVIGVAWKGVAKAYPLRQIWYHHIVNDDFAGERLAVAYCSMANTATTHPLTEPGVGLEAAGLSRGAMVMKRTNGLGRWPQLCVDAQLADGGTSDTITYGPAPTLTSLGAWIEAHPDTVVLRPDNRYQVYYAAYDAKPRGYSPGALMTASGAKDDPRLGADADVLGLSLAGDAVAVPVDLLRKEDGRVFEVGGAQVQVRWNDTLGAPEVDGPVQLRAIRCFWYAWSGYYPQTHVEGPRP